MGQHPVAQRAGTPSIDLFAKWITHHRRNADKSNETREPAHRQPTAGEHAVEAVLRNCPTNHNSQEDRCRGAAEMPRFCQRIALVNVPAYSVCLITKHKCLRRSNLAEVSV